MRLKYLKTNDSVVNANTHGHNVVDTDALHRTSLALFPTRDKFTASDRALGAVEWRPQRIARPRRPRWLAPPTPLATGIIYKSTQTGGRRILHDSVVCPLMTAPGRAGNWVRVTVEIHFVFYQLPNHSNVTFTVPRKINLIFKSPRNNISIWAHCIF